MPCMSFLRNRTVIGVFCILLSVLICFGLTPLFNRAVSQKVEIVRVTQPIRAGEQITDDMVQLVQVGGYNLPDNVLHEKANAVGKYATADLAVGDYIINTKLSDVPAADNAYLYDLDGSQQAISVTIRSFANGLSGKLQSGDIVSVVAPDYKQQGQTVIPPELQYVEVISVTASTGYDANTGEAQTDDEDGKELPSTVTLLVTPEQSKVLAELEEEGTIHLTLVYRGSKENAEKFLTAQDDVLLELYPPEPDPEEASQEETTQEETPTGTDNPEETEVETPTESEEASSPVRWAMKMTTRNISRRTRGACWQSGAAPAVARPQSPHGLQSTLPASAKTRFFSSAICPPPCCPASAHPGISKTKDLWGASWLPPMCLTV